MGFEDFEAFVEDLNLFAQFGNGLIEVFEVLEAVVGVFHVEKLGDRHFQRVVTG